MTTLRRYDAPRCLPSADACGVNVQRPRSSQTPHDTPFTDVFTQKTLEVKIRKVAATKRSVGTRYVMHFEQHSRWGVVLTR